MAGPRCKSTPNPNVEDQNCAREEQRRRSRLEVSPRSQLPRLARLRSRTKSKGTVPCSAQGCLTLQATGRARRKSSKRRSKGGEFQTGHVV